MNDTERMDWLEKTFSGVTNRERYLPVTMGWGKGCNGRSLREAIDKYMAREAPKQDVIQRGNEDLVPAETQADDGWIAWGGSEDGSMPEGFGIETKVIIRFRGSGEIAGHWPARGWDWSHNGDDGDIIAYRVVP